ncbi:MAG: putative transcriptional regulator [Polyangiaceae bacterium]|jgi:predicted DNA-binding transcriptional regulator YafY|nr:putative transcriptional regulator [Polyangiaceae bacterium]
MDKPRGRPKGKFTQHRRLDKLRELLERHPRGLTLYDMAGALGVTVRSMRRYMKEIERDSELESVPTKGGAALMWRLRSNETPRKVELRRTQTYALLAARRLFEPMRGSALFDEIDHAVMKLLALAQRPGRGPNAGLADARLEERFLYLPHAPKNYAERTEELDDLFQAVSDLRPLSLLYKSATRADEERITIHPYALVLHRDSIYCVGFHTGRQEIRTFVLDRMRDTECLFNERFELPADFHIDQYFQGEFGIWRDPNQQKVVIEFDAHAAEYIRARRVHSSQRLATIAGGGVRLTMTVGNLTQVTSWILEWGARAKVVEPPELIERIRAELTGALALYPSGPTADRSAKPEKKSKAR